MPMTKSKPEMEMPKPQQHTDELVATRYAEMAEKQIAWLTAENESARSDISSLQSRARLFRLRRRREVWR